MGLNKKPNYRINEIEKDYFDAKIITAVNLRISHGELEERTFPWLFSPCPCDIDCESHEPSGNGRCPNDGGAVHFETDDLPGNNTGCSDDY